MLLHPRARLHPSQGLERAHAAGPHGQGLRRSLRAEARLPKLQAERRRAGVSGPRARRGPRRPAGCPATQAHTGLRPPARQLAAPPARPGLRPCARAARGGQRRDGPAAARLLLTLAGALQLTAARHGCDMSFLLTLSHRLQATKPPKQRAATESVWDALCPSTV